MKIGITAYDMPATDLVDLAVAAEEEGFDSLWLGEHIVLPVGYSTPHPTKREPGVQHHTGPIVAPDTELLEPLVELAAVASATSRLRLSTGVYILPLRHPLATARAVCTLQEVSRGRFSFGIGSGWLEEEFAALDVPFGQRIGRFEETIDILRTAWAGGVVEHDGAHFHIHAVQVTPRRTEVPLIMGGNTDRALRRAARLGDGWFSSGTPPFEESLRLRDELHRLRDDAGRSGPFRLTFRMEGKDPEVAQRYADEGFDDIVIWADQVWPAGPVEAKREALASVAEAFGLRAPAA